jgi:hypothetical protein
VDVIDFDAWYEENVDPTIPFRLMGKDWEIPGDIPRSPCCASSASSG